MTDINKTFKIKLYINSQTKLSEQYYQYLNVFNKKKVDKFLLFWDEEINHDIELITNRNEKTQKLSWESLYNMIKNKLLILKKTLMKYLDKDFI